MSKLNFNPEKDIPDLTGRVILITGGTAGLGYETALSLAAHNPDQIFFTGRSESSADKLVNEIRAKHTQTRITFIRCDQTSFASVQDAARAISGQTSRLDTIIANAGVMCLPPGQTREGYEVQFGTNHLAHALLVKLLLPLLESTAAQAPADIRVIWLTSQGYAFHPKGGILFDSLSTSQSDICSWSSFFGAWYRYGQSKLTNLLYARAFASHQPSITSVAIHPGVSATGLVTGLPWTQRAFIYSTAWAQMIPPEQCAWNTQWAATCPKEELESGRFYEPVGEKGKLWRDGVDEGGILEGKLWEWTEKELEKWVLETSVSSEHFSERSLRRVFHS